MGRSIIRYPQASADLRQIAEFIAQDSEDAAIRFLDRTAETLQHLADVPDPGSSCQFSDEDLASLRYARIRQFRRYLVFFGVTDQQLALVRVMHSAQDISAAFDEAWPPP